LVSIKCRLQIRFKMKTRNKMQAADCRLDLKCRPRPKLLHCLMHDIVSIHDLYIGNEKIELKPFNAKSQKVGMLLGTNLLVTCLILWSVPCIKTPCKSWWRHCNSQLPNFGKHIWYAGIKVWNKRERCGKL